MFLLLLLMFLSCSFVFYTFNSNFFGLAAPYFEELTISKGFDQVTASDGRTWKIVYEASNEAVFSGVVRHVSHWRENDIPFVTHDVLVTTQEFSSQKRVFTRVYNHQFYFRYFDEPYPNGTINLLHIVPASYEIYEQLLQIRDWNLVTIRGREILKIDIYKPDGEFWGYWEDQGCNTILVKSVEIKAFGTPYP